MGHDGLPCRGSEDVVIEPNDAARGDGELEEGAAVLIVHHRHLALATGDDVDDLAGVLLGEVDREVLDGLVLDAVDLVDDHLGLADLQLVALAAHRLDEDGEVQHATPVDDPAIGRLGGLDAQR